MRIFGQTLRALLSHWRQHPVQFFSVLTGLWPVSYTHLTLPTILLV